MFERYAFAQHGRVAATRVWTEPNGTSKEPHKSAALAHDDEGTPTIATLCESTREVVGWRLDGDGSGPPVASFRVPDVASFVAVAATRGEDALDILAIHENSGRLALRCGVCGSSCSCLGLSRLPVRLWARWMCLLRKLTR